MRNKLVPLAATAGDTQAIAVAWARYAEEVVRHTSEASQALLRAHTFKEMLEVQAKLRRGTTQSFHDQIVKIAETASRMATRPHGALKDRMATRPHGALKDRMATRPHGALKEASVEQAGD